MKIKDSLKLPEGTKFYQVSEEVWFQTGPDDADRDFTNFQDFTTLVEAVNAVLKSDTTNRLYIDLMECSKGGAHGLPVFAGSKHMMEDGTTNGWRFSNFDAMGVERPSSKVTL